MLSSFVLNSLTLPCFLFLQLLISVHSTQPHLTPFNRQPPFANLVSCIAHDHPYRYQCSVSVAHADNSLYSVLFFGFGQPLERRAWASSGCDRSSVFTDHVSSAPTAAHDIRQFAFRLAAADGGATVTPPPSTLTDEIKSLIPGL